MMTRRRSWKLRLATLLAGLLALSFLTGCDVVEDFGRSLDDVFRGITLRFP